MGSLAAGELQVHCLHHASVVTIELPLCIVDIGNGCGAFPPALYLLARSELAATVQSLTCSQFFLQYGLQCVRMSSFVVFREVTFGQLATDELVNLHARLQALKPMSVKLFHGKLALIDENCPLTIPPWVTLGGQVISGAFILTKMALMAWFCLGHRKSVSTL